MKEKTSRIPGFYKLSSDDRLSYLKNFSSLSDDDLSILKSMSGITLDGASDMIENVVGGVSIPIGISTNFIVNNKEFLIPMATEEPSVVAACSKAAGLTRKHGGFQAKSLGNIMRTQIQLINISDISSASDKIAENKSNILKLSNEQTPTLFSLGGGAKDLILKKLNTRRGDMLIVEISIDCKDAMGANACNTVAEAVSPLLEELTGGKSILKIVSNFATERLVEASATFDNELLDGDEIIEKILDAVEFANNDPYRAVTHNKGIMNGIIASALATGQDTRAIESTIHAYASITGKYIPLTEWKKDSSGNLFGKIKIPLPVGIVGGASSVHPTAKVCQKILRIKTASELSEVIASVGLSQNLAALYALVSEGIQKGHMKLHSRNLAISVGAQGDSVNKIAEIMINENNVTFQRAKQLFNESN